MSSFYSLLLVHLHLFFSINFLYIERFLYYDSDPHTLFTFPMKNLPQGLDVIHIKNKTLGCILHQGFYVG